MTATENKSHGLFRPVSFGREMTAPQRAFVDFLFGGFGYGLIEVIWRGRTHISMVITGGVCYLLLRLIGMKMADRGILLRCAAGAVGITATEFAVGCVVNLGLGLGVWDYSSMSFNLLGQVCLLYSVLWFLLCLPIFFVFGLNKKRRL
ncbi:MAG: putative ABC transporter permease [Clostridia bacterium]|nr:putative ABC transporter permease [Clostridia bacterium]